jgi:EAL domain-containing protein (putative c-di-GMP-specific phosphodiesterase class I)
MAKNGAALAIIKAVKALVFELGVDMLVEGVETPGQSHFKTGSIAERGRLHPNRLV